MEKILDSNEPLIQFLLMIESTVNRQRVLLFRNNCFCIKANFYFMDALLERNMLLNSHTTNSSLTSAEQGSTLATQMKNTIASDMTAS